MKLKVKTKWSGDFWHIGFISADKPFEVRVHRFDMEGYYTVPKDEVVELKIDES